MKDYNDDHIVPGWVSFKRLWWIIAIILLLATILLWALGMGRFGWGERNAACLSPQQTDNPENLEKIRILEEDQEALLGRIDDLEKAEPLHQEKISIFEDEQKALLARIDELEKAEPEHLDNISKLEEEQKTLLAQIDTLKKAEPLHLEKISKLEEEQKTLQAQTDELKKAEPLHLEKISKLESENKTLLAQVDELKKAEPLHQDKVSKLEGEQKNLLAKIDELEKQTETKKPVENPEQLEKIKQLEAVVSQLKSREPEIMEKPVDNPKHLARIAELEKENRSIPELNAQISQLTADARRIPDLKTKISELEEQLRTRPKADTTSPVLELLGNNPERIEVGADWEDAGVNVSDNVDESVNIRKTSTLDTSRPGNYQITYRATDGAGNTATVTRSVLVTASPAARKPGLVGARVYFDYGSAEVSQAGRLYLLYVANFLRHNPANRISLSGFHDPSGDQAANRALANNRAATVRRTLVGYGISAERISITQPTETTGTGSPAEARRVELHVSN